MNSKWIVPIVAMILCAVSLIGAGYAAYTATLTSSETADFDQNYLVLNPDSDKYETAGEVDVYWDRSVTVTNGTAGNPLYKPYLDVETTDDAVKYGLIFKLAVVKDVSHLGDEVTDSNSYTLTIGTHSCDLLTDTVIEVYTDSALTTPATKTAMSYGTVYYIALGYMHNDADNISDGTAPPDDATVTVSVTATANLVTKS